MFRSILQAAVEKNAYADGVTQFSIYSTGFDHRNGIDFFVGV
jgi:hypothetical protein|tara:strand:+ start:2543 stop:2668 length:126 start_codon:yes stop_codon:yes gene_type:complete